MARVYNKKKRELENDSKIIIVKEKIYFRNEGEPLPCNNCGTISIPKTIYKTLKGDIVEICYFCNFKIHNSSTDNMRFRKDSILNNVNEILIEKK